jgi:hypothetical protein
MEGTVNCAKRDEGRPVFWATAAGAAGTGTGLLTTVMGTATFSRDADLAADLLATAGFDGATGASALAALPVAFAAGLETDFSTTLVVGLEAATALEAALATGLVMDFSAAFATGLEDLTDDFAGFSSTGLADACFATLASFSGFASGFVSFLALADAALDLGSFPDLAFTWSLLVELARLSSTTPWASTDTFDGLLCGASSARECTGFTIGKPISCKIETIIPLPAMILHLHNALRYPTR